MKTSKHTPQVQEKRSPARCSSCGLRAVVPTAKVREDGAVWWKCGTTKPKPCKWAYWVNPVLTPVEVPPVEEPMPAMKARRKLPPLPSQSPMSSLSKPSRRPQPGPHRATVDEIVTATCDLMGVTVDEVFGKGRHNRVVLTRRLAWDQLRRRRRMSFPEIARALGRPNHSTVMTGLGMLARTLDAKVSDLLGPNDDRSLAWGENMTVADLIVWIDVAIEAGEARVDGDRKRELVEGRCK